MASGGGPRLGLRDAVHLLRRAGFGPKRRDARRFADQTRGSAVQRLLAPDPITVLGPGTSEYDFRRWWLRKMRAGRHRLREKLTLFWHDHFGVSIEVVDDLDRMRRHIRTLRLFGMDGLRDLLLEVTRDRAMLKFLDNRRNTRTNLNENYGRELMELFTLGVSDQFGQPNYTQNDVVAMSRSLTGFDSDGNFRSSRFDSGDKTLFAGKAFEATGNLGVVVPGSFLPPEEQVPLSAPLNVFEILLGHRDSAGGPTVARHLARKLWEWFAYPDPSLQVLDDCANAFLASDYSIRELLRTILTHDEFYSEQARRSTVKNPVEFALQTVRILRVRSRLNELPDQVADMGMDLLAPPNVAGWPQGLPWVTSGPWLERLRFAQRVAAGRDWRHSYKFRPMRFIPDGATDPAEVVDAFLNAMHIEIDPAVQSQVRTALIDYFEGATDFSDPASDTVERKVRGLAVLLLSLPEFQIH